MIRFPETYRGVSVCVVAFIRIKNVRFAVAIITMTIAGVGYFVKIILNKWQQAAFESNLGVTLGGGFLFIGKLKGF